MNINKDNLLLIIGVLAIGCALFGVASRRVATPPPRQGVEVLAVLKDSDCTECVEKTLCNWQEYTAHIGGQGEAKLRIMWYSQEGKSYDTKLLEPLCSLPDIELCALSEAPSDLPYVTPSISILLDGRVFYQQPITYAMDKESIRLNLENMAMDALSRWKSRAKN